MKLFTKVMAAALLSTAISGAVMAAVDFSDVSVLANDAKGAAAKTATKAASADDMAFEITLDPAFVDSMLALNTGRFTKAPTKNLMDGLKGLYTDLAAAAGDASKLKGKLATPTVAKLTLNLTEASADYKNAVNAAELKRLADAVVDDPFVLLDATPEAGILAVLAGTKSFTRPATGGAYGTVEDAAKAYAAAKAAKKPADAQAVLDELKKMTIADHSKTAHRLTDVVAFEGKSDWTTAQVRDAKTAKATRVGVTPAQQVALDAVDKLLQAVEDGHFAPLATLVPTLAGDFEEAKTKIGGDKVKAESLVDALVAFAKSQRTLMNEKKLLEERAVAAEAALKSGGGRSTSPVRSRSSSFSESGFPSAATNVEIREALGLGASYDPSTGVLTYANGTTKQFNKA